MSIVIYSSIYLIVGFIINKLREPYIYDKPFSFLDILMVVFWPFFGCIIILDHVIVGIINLRL